MFVLVSESEQDVGLNVVALKLCATGSSDCRQLFAAVFGGG